jgi:hypothetical protein
VTSCANRQFRPARRGLDQQQIGDIGAGDQQHERNSAHQEPKSRPDVTDHLVEQGFDEDAKVVCAIGVFRILLDHPLRHGLHVGAGLLERHAGPETRKKSKPVIATSFEIFGAEREWREYLCLGLGKAEVGGQHADDDERPAVEVDGAPDHGRIPTEATLPEPVAQERDVVVPGLRILRTEHTP